MPETMGMDMGSSYPVVGHLDFTFFARSQTFIYFYLIHFRRTRPVCLSLRTPVIHRRRFPFPRQDVYGFPPRLPWMLWRAWDRAGLPGARALRFRVVGAPEAQIRWARRILEARGARLIHAHFGGVGYRALDLGEALGIPVVTTFYGTDIVGKPDWGDWPRHRAEVFARGDLILVEGPHMRQRLVDLGCPPEKVKIQHIAIEVERLPFRARSAHTGKTILCFAGRFEEKKGLLDALDAVAALRRRGVDLEFRVIGSGRLAGQVRRCIAGHGLGDCVRLLGFLDYDDYIAELGRADIFVHPSVTASDGDSEGGAPTVILEAQALGLPVVSTTHADIPFITRPGESAVLVPEGDLDALADALGDLIAHPERWAAMGRAGRAHVEARHNIHQQADRLDEMYLTMIGFA